MPGAALRVEEKPVHHGEGGDHGGALEITRPNKDTAYAKLDDLRHSRYFQNRLSTHIWSTEQDEKDQKTLKTLSDWDKVALSDWLSQADVQYSKAAYGKGYYGEKCKADGLGGHVWGVGSCYFTTDGRLDAPGGTRGINTLIGGGSSGRVAAALPGGVVLAGGTAIAGYAASYLPKVGTYVTKAGQGLGYVVGVGKVGAAGGRAAVGAVFKSGTKALAKGVLRRFGAVGLGITLGADIGHRLGGGWKGALLGGVIGGAIGLGLSFIPGVNVVVNAISIGMLAYDAYNVANACMKRGDKAHSEHLEKEYKPSIKTAEETMGQHLLGTEKIELTHKGEDKTTERPVKAGDGYEYKKDSEGQIERDAEGYKILETEKGEAITIRENNMADRLKVLKEEHALAKATKDSHAQEDRERRKLEELAEKKGKLAEEDQTQKHQEHLKALEDIQGKERLIAQQNEFIKGLDAKETERKTKAETDLKALEEELKKLKEKYPTR